MPIEPDLSDSKRLKLEGQKRNGSREMLGEKWPKTDVWVRVGAYRLCEAVCEVDTPYDIKTRIIFFIVGETETHEDV